MEDQNEGKTLHAISISKETMCNLNFPHSELELRNKLVCLMNSWQEYIRLYDEQNIQCEKNKEIRESKKVKNLAELFVADGFYPYYTEQKYKILFIGLESWGKKASSSSMKNLIDETYSELKQSKRIGDIAINKYKFHYLMFYIAYGILNGYPEYCNIPNADELVEKFACEGGFSYAFMNISKFVNEDQKQSKKADEKLINRFLKITSTSQTNFIAEEIGILKPDLIIGMNLRRLYGEYLGSFVDKKNYMNCVDSCILNIGGNQYNYLDTYNFSYNIVSRDSFYDPIIDACKEIFEENGETQTNK